ncbi:ClbS/DfsB family four-helix bundle protein [Rhodobacter sp. 24-YEA-8]|uniref:ClbS/DfsB family four-helix bundle protein n=1 Tax=Rhodobacter sp. 24-YEA-8 TaxID=1884310 RepID=UPI0025B78186|nr:ClbS/DfsB family four-helix bundle protein [Rhodobacter sp. 24-YEA-8]
MQELLHGRVGLHLAAVVIIGVARTPGHAFVNQCATPDFPETEFQWNQLGLLAQKFYADHSNEGWPSLLLRLKAAKVRLSATISARSNEELYGQPWYGKWTKGRMIQFNTSSHRRMGNG